MSSRQFVSDVIEIYKESPCLWKVSDPDYHNKNKRGIAMEKLIELFKTVDTCATRDMVQKKLSSMRCSYKKESNKVKASMKSGAGTDTVHVPKLWYYDMLSFLEDQSVPSNSQTLSSILDSMPFGYDEDCEEEENNSVPSAAFCDVVLESTPSSSQSQIKPRCKRPRSKTTESIDKITSRIDQIIEQGPAKKSNLQHDNYGLYVAEQLRSLPPNMVIYCQRVINETLYHAQMNNLNQNSTVVTSLSVMESNHL